MGARKPTQIGQAQGTSADTYANYTAPSRTTEQQAYDRTSQAYNQASQTAKEQQAYQQVQPRTTDSYATRAQPSTSSYQQMHMKMLQDRAGSGQGPMARQDTANDQRMNEYMNRTNDMPQPPRSSSPWGRRRFSWQR
jgi:hypothetical protein